MLVFLILLILGVYLGAVLPLRDTHLDTHKHIKAHKHPSAARGDRWYLLFVALLREAVLRDFRRFPTTKAGKGHGIVVDALRITTTTNGDVVHVRHQTVPRLSSKVHCGVEE